MPKAQYPINTYFSVEDVVSKNIVTKYGSQCYRWVSPYAMKGLTQFREFINLPMWINNWLTGGTFQYCGYREPGCGVGQETGAHYRMVGYDVHIIGWTGKMYLDYIAKVKSDKVLQAKLRSFGITIIEEGTEGWLHLGFENCPWLKPDEIYFVPFK